MTDGASTLFCRGKTLINHTVASQLSRAWKGRAPTWWWIGEESLWNGRVKDPVLAKRAVAVVLTRIFRGTHTDFGDAIGLVIPEEWIWHEPLPAQALGLRVQERPVGNSKAYST